MEALAVLVNVFKVIPYFVTRLILLSKIARRGKDKVDRQTEHIIRPVHPAWDCVGAGSSGGERVTEKSDLTGHER